MNEIEVLDPATAQRITSILGRALGAHGLEDYVEAKHIYLNHAR